MANEGHLRELEAMCDDALRKHKREAAKAQGVATAYWDGQWRMACRVIALIAHTDALDEAGESRYRVTGERSRR